MTWRDFFDRDHSIYVSQRHKLLHADIVAKGVASHIPSPHARVLDYGCGEALGAKYVAERCGMTTDQVYVAKARVTKRLRVLVGELTAAFEEDA